MFKFSLLAVVAVFSLLFISCGGGGGSNADVAGDGAFNGIIQPSDPLGVGGAPNPAQAYRYNGVEFWGQCWPAARRYYEAHYGFTLPVLGNYSDVGTCLSPGACLAWWIAIPNMTMITRTGTNLPQPDDMIVWSDWTQGECSAAKHTNPYGHVAVVDIAVSQTEVWVVDSNWVDVETGGRHAVRLDSCVLGWLRPSQPPPAGSGPGPFSHIGSGGTASGEHYVSWTASAGATNYRIYEYYYPYGEFPDPSSTEDFEVPGTAISGLLPSTALEFSMTVDWEARVAGNYIWRVKAINAAGERWANGWSGHTVFD